MKHQFLKVFTLAMCMGFCGVANGQVNVAEAGELPTDVQAFAVGHGLSKSAVVNAAVSRGEQVALTYEKVTINDIVYRVEGETATVYDGVKCSGAVVIPPTIQHEGNTYRVTVIANAAFYGCNALTSITVPEGVTTFGSSVFQGCSSLESASLPGSLVTMGSSTFYGCASLTRVNLPSNLTSLDYNTFSGCIYEA